MPEDDSFVGQKKQLSVFSESCFWNRSLLFYQVNNSLGNINTTADNSSPEIELSLNNVQLTPEVLNRYTGATATVKVDLKNATSATIKVSNLDAKTVTESTTFTLNSSIPYGKSVDITVTATNGKKEVSRSYNIKKKNPNEAKVVYFDNSATAWDTPYLVAKTGEAAGTCISGYGFKECKMTLVSGNLYKAEVPANANYVKFSEGPTTLHLGHTVAECNQCCGRTLPETVINYGTANSAANRERGGYLLEGAMIGTDLRFEDYGDYPVATLSNADTSLTEQDEPTEPPTEPGKKLLRGDADLDTYVNVLDVTMAQRDIATIKALSADGKLAADVDENGTLESIDVTRIQRYLANMENPYKIGQYFYANSN